MKITDNQSNEEFWQFEGRIAVRANIGIFHVAVPRTST